MAPEQSRKYDGQAVAGEESQDTTDRQGLSADTIAEPEGSSQVEDAEGSALSEISAPQDRSPSLNFQVVAFGSSAGGLQPIKDILGVLPTDTGMAFILIPHLAPDQVSHLREITEQYTAMPVHPIQDGERPQPNHLYILQPNEIAQLSAGRFVVSPRGAEHRVSHAIDIFFHSLGEDLMENAIGVVLSGADADGALGLKTIRGEGGVAIVQSPETAAHSSMPRSSISADHADVVVSPNEIGIELVRLSRQFTRPDVQVLETGTEPPTDPEAYQRIIQMLHTHSGLELRQYKQETIRRRIARRMMLLRIDSLADYARTLQVRKEELTNLQEDVLIGVTRFFRDPAFWHAFSTSVLPAFFASRQPQRAVRVWCAGCSSGEEAYSIAITFLEYMTAHSLDNTLQIFATDASERSIESARLGTYPESLVGEISPERLRRYFVKVDRGYQLSKRVRDVCIFAKQNLCTDPPFSHIDFLTCRNVLIYFNPTLQRQVMQTFHYALEPSGYLLLGMSETLRDYDDWFNPIDRKNKIYSKVGNVMPGGYHLPMHRIAPPPAATAGQSYQLDQVWSELELQRAGDRMVMARFAPPGLIIDEQLNVLQVRGQTSEFVELSSGTVSWNLLRVVRESIIVIVRDAVQHAISENTPISRVGRYQPASGGEATVQVDVLPLSQQPSGNRCFMVLFRDAEGPYLQTVETQFPPDASADEKERIVGQLRQDLSSTRFHLQSLIEERDSRNQELVSANEEIQSANEELQSTNEELETTKEELQSANEELQTVNEELQQRNAVLTQTGNDLNNLLTSVNLPLLMLTDALEIRQFTPPMEKLLSVRATDIGRKINEIRLQLSIEDIEPILRDVLDTLGTREVEVQDREGRWHLMRVRPYRTAENKIEGLVIVLVDIDQLRQSRQELREARDFADSIVARVPVPVVVISTNCTIRSVNKSFCDMTALDARELTGRSLPDLVRMKWGIDSFMDRLNDLFDAAPGTVLDFEHHSTTAEQRILLIKGQALSTDGSRVIMLTMEDITMQRHAEHDMAAQKHDLERQIQQTTETLTAAKLELEELAAYLFSVQEEERRQMARELHDKLAKQLTALSSQVEDAKNTADSGARREAMHALSSSLETLTGDIRKMSETLHPATLDELGLAAALQALVDDFREREGMIATYLGADVPDVAASTSTAVYRIAQEALRNVSRHAGKTHVKVLLTCEESSLRLEVRDLGAGFDQENVRGVKSLGLRSMQERARIAGGTLKVQSALGQGTSVILELPLA